MFQLCSSGLVPALADSIPLPPPSAVHTGDAGFGQPPGPHDLEDPSAVPARARQSARLTHQPPPCRCSTHLVDPLPLPGEM